MSQGHRTTSAEADTETPAWHRTRRWVESALAPGERIGAVTPLRGGWTSRMRRLDIEGPGEPYRLVLRSFVTPFFVRHAPGLLHREADVLRFLADTPVPAARLHRVDARARHCDHPSLLMSNLPGRLRLRPGDAERTTRLLARQLAEIHALPVPEEDRPRVYEAWTAADRVRVPAGTGRPEVWERAIRTIRRPPPDHRPRLLHRDFHPGNVLFTGEGDDLAVSGVVDWVETSCGPADLDVAHCSTALALLYGVPAGLDFAGHYTDAGGVLADDPAAHLYWRMLDALAFAPDADKVGTPWRETGRHDLTPDLLAGRLEGYLHGLFDRYG